MAFNKVVLFQSPKENKNKTRNKNKRIKIKNKQTNNGLDIEGVALRISPLYIVSRIEQKVLNYP